MHALVVMPDHVHLLLTILANENGVESPFYEILHDIKSASAHKINKVLERSERVWLEEAFDRMPRADEFDRYKEYIIMNPVRRGLVEDPDDYEWLWYESEDVDE